MCISRSAQEPNTKHWTPKSKILAHRWWTSRVFGELWERRSERVSERPWWRYHVADASRKWTQSEKGRSEIKEVHRWKTNRLNAHLSCRDGAQAKEKESADWKMCIVCLWVERCALFLDFSVLCFAFHSCCIYIDIVCVAVQIINNKFTTPTYQFADKPKQQIKQNNKTKNPRKYRVWASCVFSSSTFLGFFLTSSSSSSFALLCSSPSFRWFLRHVWNPCKN